MMCALSGRERNLFAATARRTNLDGKGGIKISASTPELPPTQLSRWWPDEPHA
jgi:hypothetical protein